MEMMRELHTTTETERERESERERHGDDERATYNDRAGQAADFIGDHQLSTYLELFASLWQRT
jgi:hypothetical protein